eukprot:COSAG05_NODE_1102_length_5875_cov_3.746364_2_plen_122_part_00
MSTALPVVVALDRGGSSSSSRMLELARCNVVEAMVSITKPVDSRDADDDGVNRQNASFPLTSNQEQQQHHQQLADTDTRLRGRRATDNNKEVGAAALCRRSSVVQWGQPRQKLGAEDKGVR